MKVIDMLDRISKGEEVKFKIIETDEVLNLTKDMHLFSITYNEPAEWFIDEEWLNYEVEVIEEDKKIEKITLDDWAEITYQEDWEMLTKDFNRNCNLFVNKINGIIDYLKSKGE